MRIPIRYQFMLPLFAVAVASLLAIAGLYAVRARERSKAGIDRQLQGVLSVLSESNFPLTDSVLRHIGELAGAELILADGDGRTIACGGNLVAGRWEREDAPLGKAGAVALNREVVVDGERYFYSAVRVPRPSSVSEPRILHIYISQAALAAELRAALIPLLLVGVLTMAAVAIVTHGVASRLRGTLARLGGDVARLAEGDFSGVRRPRCNDEVRDLAIAVDQTAQRLAEYDGELRRTERARTIAMLGAGLAHEMRNAATGCRLAVDLHAESCGQTANADDSLQVARQQLRWMEHRLQQLLQWGASPVTADNQPLDLGHLVTESVRLVQPTAIHAGVGLSWEQPEGPVVVAADSDQLRQAIVNLLLNALDAARHSRAVGKSTGFVAVALQADREASILEITDSGEGPPEALHPAIFEPFCTAKPEGIGLGLAVAQRVVESLGGKIGWQRGVDRTTFRIMLPLSCAT